MVKEKIPRTYKKVIALILNCLHFHKYHRKNTRISANDININ